MSVRDWESSLKELLLKELSNSEYPITTLFLFGSRAEGTASTGSDIDIGIKGEHPLPFSFMAHLHEKIDELNIPYKVDLVDFQKVSKEFSEHAMRGAILWKN